MQKTRSLTAVLVVVLALVLGASTMMPAATAEANPLHGLNIKANCDSITSAGTVIGTATVSDIQTPRYLTVVGQVLSGSIWHDAGAQVTVQVPVGSTSVGFNLTIPTMPGTQLRVRVVASNLDTSAGVVSNTVSCAAPTATPVPASPTPLPTHTPTAIATATATLTPTTIATSTATPTATATATTVVVVPPPHNLPTATPQPSSGGGRRSGPAPTANLPPAAVPTAVAAVPGLSTLNPPVAQPSLPASPTPTASLPSSVATPEIVVLAPPALPVTPPSCVDTTGLFVMIDEATGEQAIDAVTGLPEWFDWSGVVYLGYACEVPATPTPSVPVQIPR